MMYTEFDPLQEVIVGDSYSPGDLDNLLPKQSISGFNKILEETKQDLDNLSQQLISNGVTVHRPTVHKFDSSITMPQFDIRLPMSPLVPRDAYIVRGQTVYQTYTSLTDRYFDSHSYYDIFKKLFDQGYNWLSQPAPVLKNLNSSEQWFFDKDVYNRELSNRVLWHTATMFQAGDSVIINNKGPGTLSGLEWLKRNMTETKFVNNENTVFENFGHIDHGFILIDDETVIHAGIEWVPDALKNKRLVDVKRFLPELKLERFKRDYIESGSMYDVQWVEKYLENWKGYNQEVCFDLNVLILDSKNVVWGRDIPELFVYLKNELGINSHVTPIRHSLFWEGGVHCATLDIKRQGNSRKII